MADDILEIRVRIAADGTVGVVAPRGLQSTRIVTGRDVMPDAVGQRVKELMTDVLTSHEALLALANARPLGKGAVEPSPKSN